ncbi:MAG: peptide chain release factor N(5)-glutamine methyltransferase [Bacteroidaceae bacterium]
MNHLQRLTGQYGMREGRAIYMLVMEQRFGLSPTQVLLGKDRDLSPNSRNELDIITERLLSGEPVQYVLQECSFHGHTFHVEPGVLIPRPETGELVELITRDAQPASRILDIGTGSGCIAISLSLEGHRVTAMDISGDTLRIAEQNAKSLKADVEFLQEDILHPASRHQTWDIIASNPPYIRETEATSMEDTVLKHEPHLALFVPDSDPLLFYRAIGQYAMQHLERQGRLWFEINREFPQETCALLSAQGFVDVQALKDSYDNYRFVKATRP